MLVIGRNSVEHGLNITTEGEISSGRSCFIPKVRMKRQESLHRNILSSSICIENDRSTS